MYKDPNWLYEGPGECPTVYDTWESPPAFFLPLWLFLCALLVVVGGVLARARKAKNDEAVDDGARAEVYADTTRDVESCVEAAHVVEPSGCLATLSSVQPLAAALGPAEGPAAAITETPACDVAGQPPHALKKGRMWHLDLARVVCVFAVVHEHSGGWLYARNNDFFVLQWVLPFLYMTSAISYMLSRRPLLGYLLRLLACFLAGVGANFAAALITGFDWQSKPMDVVYQMAYVAMLAIVALLFWPLRQVLRRAHDSSGSSVSVFVVMAYGVATLACLVFHVSGAKLDVFGEDQPAKFRRSLENAPLVAYDVLSVAFLAALGGTVGYGDMLGWVLLLFIYGMRLTTPYAFVGYPHNVQLYVWAMVVQACGLGGAPRIARWVHAYWPLLICALLACITRQWGRCDLFPSFTLWRRTRFYGAEGLLAVVFVSGGMSASDPDGEMAWLTAWALYAYIFHIFWANVLPEPIGALVTCFSAVFFKLGHVALGWRRRKRRLC